MDYSDLLRCPVCFDDFDCDVTLFLSDEEKRSSRLPVLSHQCPHKICASCFNNWQLAAISDQKSDKARPPKWFKCHTCKEKTAFNAEEIKIDLYACGAVAGLKAIGSTTSESPPRAVKKEPEYDVDTDDDEEDFASVERFFAEGTARREAPRSVSFSKWKNDSDGDMQMLPTNTCSTARVHVDRKRKFLERALEEGKSAEQLRDLIDRDEDMQSVEEFLKIGTSRRTAKLGRKEEEGSSDMLERLQEWGQHVISSPYLIPPKTQGQPVRKISLQDLYFFHSSPEKPIRKIAYVSCLSFHIVHRENVQKWRSTVDTVQTLLRSKKKSKAAGDETKEKIIALAPWPMKSILCEHSSVPLTKPDIDKLVLGALCGSIKIDSLYNKELLRQIDIMSSDEYVAYIHTLKELRSIIPPQDTADIGGPKDILSGAALISYHPRFQFGVENFGEPKTPQAEPMRHSSPNMITADSPTVWVKSTPAPCEYSSCLERFAAVESVQSGHGKSIVAGPTRFTRRSDLLNKLEQVGVGSRVGIYWPLDKIYYPATIIAEHEGWPHAYAFLYDDGETESFDLSKHQQFKILDDVVPKAALDAITAASNPQPNAPKDKSDLIKKDFESFIAPYANARVIGKVYPVRHGLTSSTVLQLLEDHEDSDPSVGMLIAALPKESGLDRDDPNHRNMIRHLYRNFQGEKSLLEKKPRDKLPVSKQERDICVYAAVLKKDFDFMEHFIPYRSAEDVLKIWRRTKDKGFEHDNNHVAHVKRTIGLIERLEGPFDSNG